MDVNFCRLSLAGLRDSRSISVKYGFDGKSMMMTVYSVKDSV